MVEVWTDWIRLNKENATLGEELPPAELLPAKLKEQSPDQKKRDASREEFGLRELAKGNMWESLSCLLTFLESFGKTIQKCRQRVWRSKCVERQCSTAGDHRGPYYIDESA